MANAAGTAFGKCHLAKPFCVLLPVMIVAMLTVAPAIVIGQTLSASIIGQVRDEGGGALPGVTVTLRSPAMQVPEVAVITDARGEYRATQLPIGVYSVTYTLPGFQTLQVQGIRLTTGFSAKLDQVMKIGGLEETVTVSGQSPLVDVTQASTATTLEAEALELIPTGTNGIVSFLSQVPGAYTNVDVGGSTITDTNRFDAHGQSGEMWALLEGVFAAASQTSSSGTHYNYNAIDEARVQTSGNGAQTPKRGMSVDMVVKSGSNEFHGAGQFAMTNHNFESDNIGDELRAQGVVSSPKLITRKDGGGQLGGWFIRDRLWFFADLRYRQIIREIPFAAREDGSIIQRPQHQFFQTYKLTGQLNATNRIIPFWNRYGDHERRGASQFVPERAMEQNNAWGETWKIEWLSVPTTWLTLSVQHGNFEHVNQYTGFAPGVPRSRDIETLIEDGDALSAGRVSSTGSFHDKATLSMYKSDFLGGNHSLTVGFDFMDGGNRSREPARRSGDYRLNFDDGVPYQINVYNYPTNPRLKTRYFGAYVQDSVTVGRRLTLSVGLRGQRDRGWVPEHCQAAGSFAPLPFPTVCYDEVHPNVFTTFTPRFHAAMDLTGDGKTVLKGGYGRFAHLRSTGSELNIYNLGGNRNMTFAWRDLNGNRDYDPGEVNLDPNGGDFRSGGSQTRFFLNPDEEAPRSDEFSLGFERHLLENLAVRVAGIVERNFNYTSTVNPLIPYEAYTIPITNPDPGPDGSVGTADDPGARLTYWEYPEALDGADFEARQIVNEPDRYNSSYKTVEVAATKRLANSWQFMASYSATKINNPGGSLSNPNSEINAGNHTWTWIGKTSGSYTFPKDIVGGFSYTLRNGARLARQVQLRGGRTITNIVVNAEPIGSLNLENIGLLDVRVAKRFRLQGGHAFEVRLDCFNFLNANPVTSIVTRSGSTFGNATASAGGGQNGTGLTPPRIFQFEVDYSF